MLMQLSDKYRNELRGFYDEGKADGRAEGRAESILTVLRSRELPVSAEQERRITQCQDQALLSRWLVRAVKAARTEDIFQET